MPDRNSKSRSQQEMRLTDLSNLLHVCDHLIVTLSLLAEPRKESLAVVMLASHRIVAS